MPVSRLLRPAFAAVLALAAAAPLPAASRAPARREAPALALVVDVARLRLAGLGPSADLVQEAAYREFAAAGVAGPGGARLVVRFEALSLNAFAGSDSGGGGGAAGGGGGGSGTNTDYLEGEALVVGAGGQVVARYRHVLALPANSGGAYYLPGAEQRRISILARTFAEWVRRDLA